jgi:hypothetical protein
MKNIFTFIALFIIGASFGQVALRKSSLSSGGGSATTGNLYMVYALGEIGVQEADAGNIHLSEGFVGPDITAIVGIEDYGILEGITVFPNPVKEHLNITLPQDNSYEIHLFDLTGKEVLTKNIENNNSAQYNLSRLKTGLYLLVIIDRENQLSATVKLQKL